MSDVEPPAPKPGEIRVMNGRQWRFIERELGDKWELVSESPVKFTVRSPSQPRTTDITGGICWGPEGASPIGERETAELKARIKELEWQVNKLIQMLPGAK